MRRCLIAAAQRLAAACLFLATKVEEVRCPPIQCAMCKCSLALDRPD